MVWGCIFCDGVGPLAKIDGRMKGNDYIDLLHFHTCSQWEQNTLVWMIIPLAIEPVYCHNVYQQPEAYGGVASTEPGF